jgi:hypothetical protein
MASIVVAGDTSGTVTLAAPLVAGTTTLTLPTTNGTVLTTGSTTGVNASAISTGTLAAARLPAGSVLQVASTAKTDTFTTTSSASFVEVTGLSVSITPTSTSSKILIIAGVSLGAQAGLYAAMPRLARNGTAIFLSDAAGSRIRAAAMFEVGNACTFPVAINFLDSPNTTSATTYSIQLITNTGGQPARVNASAEDRDASNWSRSVSSITVMEIAG